MGTVSDVHIQLPRHASLLFASLGLLALACAVGSSAQRPPADLPPQSWWEDRGPVVPHDTFPSDCSLCHAGGDWNTIRDDFVFDHEAETGTPLDGAHARAECLRCHNDRGPVEVFARQGCSGCHEDIHRGRLGGECAVCHDEVTWEPNEQIALHNRTRFPLVAAHAATACWRCHPGATTGNFDRAPVECATCHADDLARALDPDHQALGFVSACDRCHIPTTWTGGGFNHASFPLTGAHTTLDCDACHAGGVFAGTPNTCAGCHLDDYNGTTDPDHQAAGFPTMCEQCHTTVAWGDADFSHAGVTMGCDQCHLSDYLATTDPDHQALNFPTSCEQCHLSTRTWSGALFDHQGISRGCETCHLDDYLGTTNPNHQAAGFPTSCEACHDTLDWANGVFNHSFPIQGPHNLACGDCHLQPGNFRSFSCTHCHEHSQRQAGKDHSRVQGYSWNSAACLSCHPNGDN